MLVDAQATIAARFGINYVPFAILLDETGNIVRPPYPSNINVDDHRSDIANWIKTGEFNEASTDKSARVRANGFDNAEAELRFAYAGEQLRRGQNEMALAQLKTALKLDSDNWLIRKQIWAIENPERFYSGKVDFKWQHDQMNSERLQSGEKNGE